MAYAASNAGLLDAPEEAIGVQAQPIRRSTIDAVVEAGAEERAASRCSTSATASEVATWTAVDRVPPARRRPVFAAGRPPAREAGFDGTPDYAHADTMARTLGSR